MSQLFEAGTSPGKLNPPQAAETQAAILNALPAHIALFDPDGVILVVNESWRYFATANVLRIPDFGLGAILSRSVDGPPASVPKGRARPAAD